MDWELYEESFLVRLIAPCTWMIETVSDATPVGCDCYLLAGDEQAILIDAGMSRLNLKSYIEALHLTEKPLAGVINTHSHFDHTVGNWAFDHAYMHPLAEAEIRKMPNRNMDGDDPDYTISHLTENAEIDLGNRKLKILEIGAHDPSSIAILDTSRNILFTGDELECGWINIGSGHLPYDPAQTIESHYQNMVKLKSYSHLFETICTGHHGSPIATESLEHFLTCDEMILNGIPGDPHIPFKNGKGLVFPEEARVMRYKTAHICYRIDRITKQL